MGSYIDHAAYYTADISWHVTFFREVFGMEVEKEREEGGLRQVWLTGGVQLCQTREIPRQPGHGAHLCLITDDLERSREKALAFGCEAMPKHHWIRLPEGLCIELFPAAPGAVEALRAVPKRM